LQNDDILAGIAGAFSGVFAFLSWLWSIPVLQFGFTFILGTSVTYIVQSKLQDRADKRKIIRENIERMHGPLKQELQEYRESIIDNLEAPSFQAGVVGDINNTTWKRVKTLPEFFSIPSKLQQEMEEIMKIELSIIRRLDAMKEITDSYLLAAAASIPRSKNMILSRQSFRETLYITARSNTGAFIRGYFLHDCVLLDKNPIELARKEFPEFSINQSTLHIASFESFPRRPETYPPQIIKDRLEIGLTRIQTEVQQILNEAGTNAAEDKRISKFSEDRKELSQRIDKILPIIEKYIAKHYPVEEI
jgi:hypothetical protein